MGNCVSVSFQFSAADSAGSQCWECTNKRAKYVCDLEENLAALKIASEELTDAKNDLVRKVNVAEQQQRLKRWILRVEAMETEVGELMAQSTQEVDKLCLSSCCSLGFVSSYKFGKKVSQCLGAVNDLLSNRDFEVVTESAPDASVAEMPLEPTVGFESLFDMVGEVLSRLKFSYDSLSSQKVIIVSCIVLLFPEDWEIGRIDLLEYWVREGFLGENDDIERAKNEGCDIMGSLLHSCLLEEVDDKFINIF